MAFPSDAIDNVDLKALAAGGLVREDVSNQVWRLSELETPFQDLVGTDTCNQDYTEWVQDELGSPSLSNVRIHGSDPSTYETATGARVGNRTQINARTIAVSSTAEASDTVGSVGKLAYQTMIGMQRVRQDVEAHVTSNQASVADNNNNTAGKAGGFSAFIATNDSVGSGGASGGFNTATKAVDAPTPGVARALSWAYITDAVLKLYQAYAKPTVLMSTPAIVKRINDALLDDSVAGKYRTSPVANVNGSGGAVAQTAQGFYQYIVTPFGFTLKVVPNRLQQTYTGGGTSSNVATAQDVLIIDPARAAVATLDGYRVTDLGKTSGLNSRRDITVQWTLKVYNEKAHAVIRDIKDVAVTT